MFLNLEMIGTAETALKVMRLVSSMNTQDLTTTTADAINILRIIACAPHGANLKQIASLNNRQDELYTQAILNLLVSGGLVSFDNNSLIYTLGKGGR